MKKVAQFIAAVMALTGSMAFAQTLDVVATVVSTNSINENNPVVVRFAVANNTTSIAPQSATFRVRWDATNLTFVGTASDPNETTFATGVTYGSAQLEAQMGPVVDSGVPGTDAEALPNFIDISTIGPPALPATELNPVVAFVKFTVTAAGQAAGSFNVSASILDTTTNHFPYITLIPPAVESLDGPAKANLVFVPVSLTSVADWSMLAE